MKERRGLFGLDWVPVVAAALASVSSAVILSTLGASGTLIGAAVGSIVATVSSAMYTRGLQTSREKVAVVFQGGAVGEVSVEEAEQLAAEGALADDQVNEEALDMASGAAERRTLGQRFAAINWRKVAPWAIGTFVVVMVAITAFEMIGGKPVSSLTGGSDGKGTSISRLVDRDGNKPRDRQKRPEQEPSKSGSTEQPGDDNQSEQPAPEPTETPSQEPSSGPTETPVVPTEPVETETVTPEPLQESEPVQP